MSKETPSYSDRFNVATQILKDATSPEARNAALMARFAETLEEQIKKHVELIEAVANDTLIQEIVLLAGRPTNYADGQKTVFEFAFKVLTGEDVTKNETVGDGRLAQKLEATRTATNGKLIDLLKSTYLMSNGGVNPQPTNPIHAQKMWDLFYPQAISVDLVHYGMATQKEDIAAIVSSPAFKTVADVCEKMNVRVNVEFVSMGLSYDKPRLSIQMNSPFENSPHLAKKTEPAAPAPKKRWWRF